MDVIKYLKNVLKLGQIPKFGLINSTEASRSNRAQTSPRGPRKWKSGLVLVFGMCAKTNVNEQTIVLHTVHVPVGYRGTIHTFDQRRCSFSEGLDLDPRRVTVRTSSTQNQAPDLKATDDARYCHWNNRNCPETCSNVCRMIEFNKRFINVYIYALLINSSQTNHCCF